MKRIESHDLYALRPSSPLYTRGSRAERYAFVTDQSLLHRH